MLSNILKEEYAKQKKEDLKKFYENPLVCGCLFQSFDDFTKNIILRFIANQGQLKDRQLKRELNQNDPTVLNEVKQTLLKLQELLLIQYSKSDLCYKLIKVFSVNLQTYILNPIKLGGSQLPKNYKNQMEEFDLLRLLEEENPILKECGLTLMNWRSNADSLTKENFDYIRAPVYQKIGILIKGYLRHNKSKAKLLDILVLSLLDPKKAYKITQKNAQAVNELQSLKLLKKINENNFIISKYLNNFAFYNKKYKCSNRGSLKCKIIIQTNFKVYTQISSENHDNYNIIKSILKSLVLIEHQEYQFEELIVASISKQKILALLKKGINTQQFFDFFQQYIHKANKVEEIDLGKWNKIKFLGLQGTQSGSAIPNNVKQEIKLWENMQKNKPLYEFQDYDSDGSLDSEEKMTKKGR